LLSDDYVGHGTEQSLCARAKSRMESSVTGATMIICEISIEVSVQGPTVHVGHEGRRASEVSQEGVVTRKRSEHSA
jgi:hypothetical protein